MNRLIECFDECETRLKNIFQKIERGPLPLFFGVEATDMREKQKSIKRMPLGLDGPITTRLRKISRY